MTAKILTCIAMFCATVAQAGVIAPIFNVAPAGLVGGNRQWAVTITPDASLFSNNPPNGTGGSVAAEFGFMVGPGSLINVVKDSTNFPQNNPGTAIPGYPTGSGVQIAGNKAIANLGSDFFTTATPKLMVTITTLGSGFTTIDWLGAYSGKGRIAQAGQNFDLYSGSISVPEPTTSAFALLLATAILVIRRRRLVA